MRKAISSIVQLMNDLCTEKIRVSDFGLEFEGMSLDYVVIMDGWQGRGMSVSFVSGEPEDKFSMWLNSGDVSDDKVVLFDALCYEIVDLMN